METIFLNTKNSKTNEPNRFIYQFTDNMNLKILTKIWHYLLYVEKH